MSMLHRALPARVVVATSHIPDGAGAPYSGTHGSWGRSVRSSSHGSSSSSSGGAPSLASAVRAVRPTRGAVNIRRAPTRCLLAGLRGAGVAHAVLPPLAVSPTHSRRAFFVQSTPTPNDECVKFFAEGHRFLEPGYGTVTFDRFTQHLSPLANTLLNGHHDVVEVTIGETFVTVRRREDGGDDDEALIEELREHGHFVRGSEENGDTGGDGENRAHHQLRQEQFMDWATSQVPRSGGSSGGTNTEGADGDNQRMGIDADHRDMTGGTVPEQQQQPRVGEAPLHIPPPLPWEELQLHVCALLTDHLFSAMPHLTPDAPHPHPDTLISDSDSDVVASIKELIASTIRPQLQDDGGDIRFVEFREPTGEMLVEMLGACKKCKSSGTTLKQLIERTTQHWIPEVTQVIEWKAAANPKTKAP